MPGPGPGGAAATTGALPGSTVRVPNPVSARADPPKEHSGRIIRLGEKIKNVLQNEIVQQKHIPMVL